jgi:uncharacterized membrane protein (DUF4010 family)
MDLPEPLGGSIDTALLANFATAALLGALVGVDRERRSGEQPVFGGLRTFVLISLMGACASWLGAQLALPSLVLAGLLGLVVLLSVSYLRMGGEEVGLTGEIAAVVVYLLGAACGVGQRELAVVLGITTSVLLAFKQPLHSLVAQVGEEDLAAGLKLLVATFIVLPLLPREPVDPWGVIVPYRVWWLVVLISGLSLLGYAAVRALGERKGLLLTGIFGGLVSSTAVTMSAARQSQQGMGAAALAMSVLAAWGVMFVRVVVEVALVNRALLWDIAPPMVAMAAAAGVCAGVFGWHQPEKGDGVGSTLKNPFSLWEAVKFAALFTGVRLTVELSQRYVGDEVLYVVAALAGTTDVDAITLSVAELAREKIAAGTAVAAIGLATASNTLVKLSMVWATGTRELARLMSIGTGVIAAAGLLAGVLSVLW